MDSLKTIKNLPEVSVNILRLIETDQNANSETHKVSDGEIHFGDRPFSRQGRPEKNRFVSGLGLLKQNISTSLSQTTNKQKRRKSPTQKKRDKKRIKKKKKKMASHETCSE